MKDQYPVRAIGMGGRQVRTGPGTGHIYDHFAVVYEYADGAKLFSNCRQQKGCKNDMSGGVLGHAKAGPCCPSATRACPSTRTAIGSTRARPTTCTRPSTTNCSPSIRAGKPINNGDYMARSTLLAIMGRMAAYTGQQITWEMALNSKEDLSPPEYNWDVKLPDPSPAIPGMTRFI